VPTPLEQLLQLRQLRQRKERDHTIAPAIVSISEQIRTSDRKLTQLVELWRELVPEHLQHHATPTRVHSGVLHVEVDCAATAYEVDRLMRGGVEQTLRSRYNGTLLRVKCSQKKREG